MLHGLRLTSPPAHPQVLLGQQPPVLQAVAAAAAGKRVGGVDLQRHPLVCFPRWGWAAAGLYSCWAGRGWPAGLGLRRWLFLLHAVFPLIPTQAFSLHRLILSCFHRGLFLRFWQPVLLIAAVPWKFQHVLLLPLHHPAFLLVPRPFDGDPSGRRLLAKVGWALAIAVAVSRVCRASGSLVGGGLV